ncbi:MAG: hypothetical protein M0T71_05825 [Actinomycetota bacterium]|jgi:RNA polymerase-binding transcription factor DksA|nr:hypothetical protein [Actinomycetota bacterium]
MGDEGAADEAAVEAEQLADRLGSDLAALEAALGRVEDGSYGRCEVCGEDIGDEVLAEAPAAVRCHRHGVTG